MRHGRERKRIDVDRKSVIHKSNNSGILLFNRRARTSKCFSNERIGRWRKRVDSLRSSECELKFDFSCLPRTRAASYIMLASGQRKKGQNRTEVAALHRMRAFARLDLFTAKRELQSFAFRYNAPALFLMISIFRTLMRPGVAALLGKLACARLLVLPRNANDRESYYVIYTGCFLMTNLFGR